METWDAATGEIVPRNTGGNPDGMRLSAYAMNTLPELTKREPTKAHEAVMTEFAIRWPCPKDTDPEFYEARLSLLMRDCAGIAPAMMRKAGDVIALRPGRPTVIPSAAEIVEAVEAVMAARAARATAKEREERQQQPGAVQIGDKAAAYHRANLRHMQATGGKVMQTDDGELFRLGDPGERRGLRADGSAIVPWHHHNDGPPDTVPSGWYVKKEDAATLARCYADFGAAYRMIGSKIIEVEA